MTATAVTDAFGEFKIEGLTPDSGRYRVVIEVAGREAKRLDVELKKSVDEALKYVISMGVVVPGNHINR